MIDLLYLTEGEENLNDRKNTNDIPEGLKTHYVFITDFTRLMLSAVFFARRLRSLTVTIELCSVDA